MVDQVVKDIALRLTMQQNGFTQSVQQINRQMRVVQSEFKNASATITGMGNSMEGLNVKSLSLNKQLDLQKQKLGIYEKQLLTSSQTLEKNVTEQERLGKALDETRIQLDQANRSYGKSAEETKVLQQEVSRLQKAFQQKTQMVNRNVTALQNYQIKVNTTEAQEQALRKQLDLVNVGLKEQQSAWFQTGVRVDESVSLMDKQIELLNSRFGVLTAGTTNFGKSTAQLRQQSAQLSNVLTIQGERVDALRTKYEALRLAKGADNVATQKAELELNKAIVAMKNTEAELGRVSVKLLSTSRTSAALGQISTNAQKASDRLREAGMSASFLVSLPLAVGLGKGVESFLDFNKELTTLRALLNDGSVSSETLDHQVQVLGKDAQKWAQQFGESTSDVNAGTEELIKRGFTYNQVIGAMPVLLDAARASGDDFGTVMNIVSSTVEQFGLKAQDTNTMMRNTQRAADDLTFVANKTAAGFSDMGFAMKYVGPISQAVGFSLEDTASAIGLLSNNGILGQKAGTGLREVMSRLLKPTKESAAAFKEMGVNTDDLKNGFITLPDLIDTINTHTQGLNKAEKSRLTTIAFGLNAQSAINILLSQGGDALRDLSKETQNATGYTQKLSNEMGTNAQLKVKQLVSVFQVMEQEIGKELVPEITPLIKETTHLIQEFGDLDETQKKNIIRMALFATAIGPVTLGVGALLKPVQLLTGGLGKVIGTLGKFRTEAKLAGDAAKVEAAGGIAATAGEGIGLEGVLTALTGPVGLTIGVLGALGVAGFEVYKHFKEASQSSQELQKVSLDAANSAQQQYESNNKLIDSFDQLRSKSKLTNDEFGNYLDLQDDLKKDKDPVALKNVTQEMDTLQKKSGLSNDQFDRLLDLNKKITDQIPGAAKVITDEGNRVADTTGKVKEYNKAFLDDEIRKLQEQRNIAMGNQETLQEKITSKQKDYNDGLDYENYLKKQLDNFNENANKLEIERVKSQLKQVDANSLLGQNLQAQLTVLEGGRAAIAKELGLTEKQNDKTKAQLDQLEEKKSQLDAINTKLVSANLQEAGISKKQADQIAGAKNYVDLIDTRISKLETSKDKIIDEYNHNKLNTAEFDKQIGKVTDQIRALEKARAEVVAINSGLSKSEVKKITFTGDTLVDATRINNALAKRIYKNVVVNVDLPAHTQQHIFDALPHGATGFKNFKGGLAVVGEKGPELVRLPKGADVFDHQNSIRIANQMANFSQLASVSQTHQVMSPSLAQQPQVVREIIVLPNGVTADFNLDGKSFAKSTAKFTQDEINRLKSGVQKARGIR